MDKCGKVQGPTGRNGASQKWPDGLPSDRLRALGAMMRACSACAGDYEDPDRTAPTAGEAAEAEQDDDLNSETERSLAEA